MSSNTCDNCPSPGVIVNHIIFTLSKRCRLHNAPEMEKDKYNFSLKDNSSPNFGATIAAGKIIAERFHLRVEKSAIG